MAAHLIGVADILDGDQSPPRIVRCHRGRPVSAFMQAALLSPVYLLESVEGGRLGRFSFIGFGESTRVRRGSGNR
jgi:hypothetical protein